MDSQSLNYKTNKEQTLEDLEAVIIECQRLGESPKEFAQSLLVDIQAGHVHKISHNEE